MPINVAVEEPRARIVSKESDRDIIAHARVPHAYDIADDGVVEVISLAAGAADDVEGVSVQVNRVLSMSPQPLVYQIIDSRNLTDLPVHRVRLRVY